MRIRHTIIAPLILTIGAIGSLVAARGGRNDLGRPAATSAAASPDAYVYHA